MVDTLAAAGLVERRPDPDDRRATLVALTTRGTEVMAAIRAARAAEPTTSSPASTTPTAPR